MRQRVQRQGGPRIQSISALNGRATKDEQRQPTAIRPLWPEDQLL
jgi:hypothetical protein